MDVPPLPLPRVTEPMLRATGLPLCNSLPEALSTQSPACTVATGESGTPCDLARLYVALLQLSTLSYLLEALLEPIDTPAGDNAPPEHAPPPFPDGAKEDPDHYSSVRSKTEPGTEQPALHSIAPRPSIVDEPTFQFKGNVSSRSDHEGRVVPEGKEADRNDTRSKSPGSESVPTPVRTALPNAVAGTSRRLISSAAPTIETHVPFANSDIERAELDLLIAMLESVRDEAPPREAAARIENAVARILKHLATSLPDTPCNEPTEPSQPSTLRSMGDTEPDAPQPQAAHQVHAPSLNLSPSVPIEPRARMQIFPSLLRSMVETHLSKMTGDSISEKLTRANELLRGSPELSKETMAQPGPMLRALPSLDPATVSRLLSLFVRESRTNGPRIDRRKAHGARRPRRRIAEAWFFLLGLDECELDESRLVREGADGTMRTVSAGKRSVEARAPASS